MLSLDGMKLSPGIIQYLRICIVYLQYLMYNIVIHIQECELECFRYKMTAVCNYCNQESLFSQLTS